MTKKQRAVLAVEALKQAYPDAICSLTYRDPLQLLIATRLSAQCTDARVNMVAPALFERFPTVNDFAEASYDEVAAYIKSCRGARHHRSADNAARRRQKDRQPDLRRHLRQAGCGGGHPLHPHHHAARTAQANRPKEDRDGAEKAPLHGRAVCTARTAKCSECCMKDFCPTGIKELKHAD